jgi:hypothetical protein
LSENEGVSSVQEKRADKTAVMMKQAGTAYSLYGVLIAAVIAVIFTAIALFSLSIGAPWYVAAALMFAAAGIIALSVVTLKRTAGVDLHTLNEPVPESVPLEAGEAVVDTIPAVMRYLVTRSTSYLGAGKIHHPENALIITNRAIWVVTVPLAGADKVVGETDIGRWQWMWQYKEIDAMLQEMLQTLPLEEVFKQGRAKRLMGLEELRIAKTRPLSLDIRLIRTDGKTFRYSIRLKEDYLRAKRIFKIG